MTDPATGARTDAGGGAPAGANAPTGASRLPAPAPTVTLETEEFWRATAAGTFLLARCSACGAVIWYPRSFCPACSSMATEWFEASGLGTVYTFTIVRRGQGQYAAAAPYVVAYVELDEGPRVLTNIVDCDPHDVAVGQRVEVVFHDTGDGSALYRFRPAAS